MRIFVILFLHATLVLANTACGEKKSSPLESNGTDNSAGPPVTRSEVIRTADQYARLHWTMSATNQTGISCGDQFRSQYPTGDRIGVGYKWGGWTDTADFLQKIEEGYGTGTGGGMHTYDYYSIDCVAGVSCTGFVSRAWQLYEKYTLCYSDPEIPRKFCDICETVEGVDFGTHQVDALKKGDIFINDSHTILFVYETRDGNAMVMDSSYPGVRFRQITWMYLAFEGYSAMRYNNIRELVDSRGTMVMPIVIRSSEFPFLDDGNTRDVVSMEFDRYFCEPTISEVGPEVIYKLEMRSAGTVTMTVTDIKDEGIDNNIHLLRSLDRIDSAMLAMDCIARADNTITTALDEGCYFIVIDSSSDMPGEYTLSVDFD